MLGAPLTFFDEDEIGNFFLAFIFNERKLLFIPLKLEQFIISLQLQSAAVNFINILQARFSCKILAPKSLKAKTKLCNFLVPKVHTKNVSIER